VGSEEERAELARRPGFFASEEAIVILRGLHVEMDRAVALAYGWPIIVDGRVIDPSNPPRSTVHDPWSTAHSPLDLAHGFHETKQGIRFTISESARREVLARLLRLNHERYAEEVEQGLHHQKGKAKPASTGRGRKSKHSPATTNFLDENDDPDPANESDDAPTPTRKSASPESTRADRRVQPAPVRELAARPTPVDQVDIDAFMAAFRRAARNRGWFDRGDLLKKVSVVLGYQRIGPKIEEALRDHLRAAIRRRIIEADGLELVSAGTATMADYGLEDRRETFRSVMRKGPRYEREDVIHSLARYLGFVRLTDISRDAIKSAINSGIRQGIMGYDGSVIWRLD